MRGGGGGPAVSSHSRVSMTAEGVLEGERRVPYREAPISRRYFWIPELNNNNNNDNDNKKEQKMSRNERHNEAVDGGNETAPRSFFLSFFLLSFPFSLSLPLLFLLGSSFLSFFLSFFFSSGAGQRESMAAAAAHRFPFSDRIAGWPDRRMAGWPDGIT